MRGKWKVKASDVPVGAVVYIEGFSFPFTMKDGLVLESDYHTKYYLHKDSIVYLNEPAKPAKPSAGKLLHLKKSLRALVAVMDYGDKNHEPGSWKNNTWQHHVDKALRHLLFYENDVDESGMDHLWHALCNLAFAVELKERETGKTSTS